MLRFYQGQPGFYWGVDLHARTLSVGIVDQAGRTLVHRNLPAAPAEFLERVRLDRGDLVVAVECLFPWYWLADVGRAENIPFVLGQALAMRALPGGKTQNDRIDSEKIARRRRGGMRPQAYVDPQELRSPRDLLRRRMPFVRPRAAARAHVQNTFTQDRLPSPEKRLSNKGNRVGVAGRFTDKSVRQSVVADLALIEHLDEPLREVELFLERHAQGDDPRAYELRPTVPGIGRVLALVMLYEIHDVRRFDRGPQFASSARRVRCQHESAGKKTAGKGNPQALGESSSA